MCAEWTRKSQADERARAPNMNKPEKPTAETKPRDNETARKPDRVTAEKKANVGAVETLTDITNRSANLFHAFTLKSSGSDDGYQVIDPKTVTATFQEFAAEGRCESRSDHQGAICVLWRIWRCCGSEPHACTFQYACRTGHRASQAGQAVQKRGLDRELVLRLREAALSAAVALS